MTEIRVTLAEGAPEISSCAGDWAKFAADLQAWIVRNFSQVYAAMAAVRQSSYDLCAEVNGLSGNCMIGASEIDQTGFTYAESADEEIAPGSGVLPYINLDAIALHRSGSRNQATYDTQVVAIRPPLPDTIGTSFAVILGLGNDTLARCVSDKTLRKNSGDDDAFGIRVIPEDNAVNAWVYHMVVPIS